jgi:cyclic lactone autoinducer peptide
LCRVYIGICQNNRKEEVNQMTAGFVLLIGKVLAAMASSIAFLSNFTSCVIFVNQPHMPERVRLMKK